MPAYPGSNQAPLLYENQQYYLWFSESVAAGAASRAVQLRRERGASIPFGASIEVSFSGDPGTFSVDVQTADSDVDGRYIDLSGVSAVAVNSSNVARIEFGSASLWCKYMRLRLSAITNAVTVTAMVSR